MRKILGDLGSGERHTFQADFEKYGYKRYHDASRGDLYSATIVVRNVEIMDDPDHPRMMTDHLWLNLTKGFSSLGLLKQGDRIQFNGRVSQYTKGFINKDKVDYELTYPSKVKLLNKRDVQPLPTDHQVVIGMIMNLNYKFYNNMKRPLVPYFMDAFDKWQKEQDNPLPIKCHKGNDFENASNYDLLDYKDEKSKLDKKIDEKKRIDEQKQKEGLAILRKQPDLVKELIAIGKKAKENGDDVSEKYCYVSGGKITKLLSKYNLDKTVRSSIKMALATDWFHEQFDGQKEQQLSPLEMLANKFNH